MTDTDHGDAIPVQLHMTEGDFLTLIDSSMQWGVWKGRDVEEGRFEPLDDENARTVSLEWSNVHWFMERADLILATSYLIARGEKYERLVDLANTPSPDDESDERWPIYVLLTNVGVDWDEDPLLCPSCGTPTGVHWEGCPYYASLKETMPGLDDPMEERWRGAKTATIGRAFHQDDDDTE